MSKPTSSYKPSKERPYFFYAPEGSGFLFYATSEERDKAAKKEIECCLCDDGWWEEGLAGLLSGKVTHMAAQTNVKKIPPLDEDGIAEDGRYYDADMEYTCNYELLELENEK